MNHKPIPVKNVLYYTFSIIAIVLACILDDDHYPYLAIIKEESFKFIWSEVITIALLSAISALLFLIGSIKNKNIIIIKVVYVVLILAALLQTAYIMDWGKSIAKNIYFLAISGPFCILCLFFAIFPRKPRWPRIFLISFSIISIGLVSAFYFKIVKEFPREYKYYRVKYIQEDNPDSKVIRLYTNTPSDNINKSLTVASNHLFGSFYSIPTLRPNRVPDGNWYRVNKEGDPVCYVVFKKNIIVFTRIIPGIGNTSSSNSADIIKNAQEQKEGRMMIQNAEDVSIGHLSFEDKDNLIVEVIDENKEIKIQKDVFLWNCRKIEFNNLYFYSDGNYSQEPLVNIFNCDTVVFNNCRFIGNRNVLVECDSLSQSVIFNNCSFKGFQKLGLSGYYSSNIKFDDECDFEDSRDDGWYGSGNAYLLKNYPLTSQNKKNLEISLFSKFSSESNYRRMLEFNDTIHIDSIDADDEITDVCYNVYKAVSEQVKDIRAYNYLSSPKVYNLFSTIAGFNFQQELENGEGWEDSEGDLYCVHVSPKFIKWFGENMIPEPQDSIGETTYGKIYTVCALPIRMLYETGLYLHEFCDIDEEMQWYKNAVTENDYSLFYLAEERYHFYPMSCSNNHHLNFYEPSGDEESEYYYSTETRNTLKYMTFWDRRFIDGSGSEIWNVVTNFMKKYDKEWMDMVKQEYDRAKTEGSYMSQEMYD